MCVCVFFVFVFCIKLKLGTSQCGLARIQNAPGKKGIFKKNQKHRCLCCACMRYFGALGNTELFKMQAYIYMSVFLPLLHRSCTDLYYTLDQYWLLFCF